MAAQAEAAAREARQAQIVSSLRFLCSPDPLEAFAAVTNPERVSVYAAKRIPASPGMGYCMDERPPLHGTATEPLVDPLVEASNPPKPAMVAGAAGWMMYFRLMGLDVANAASATSELYMQMGWGRMEVHNDDHHGHITSMDELKENKAGCGALGVKDDALAVVFELLKDEMPHSIRRVENDVPGAAYIDEIVKRGGKIVPLTKDHKTKMPNPDDNADVVVNLQPGTTIDREAAYDTTPCFVWDAGSTVGPVLGAFNRITNAKMQEQNGKQHSPLTGRQFIQLQAALHLAVGDLLGATHLKPNGNVVLLK